ncbi:MAG: DMP19 family protein [Planctomycetes bacterium]|nr:DMP19 family protein [Planctomycetota bacterium]
MASNNRAALINKVLKVAKRHFKPVETEKNRTLLEHLLYACCLEASLYDAADKVFEDLSQQFYDWNEVRVTSVRELATIMKPLNDPIEAAKRLKRVLQSVFETHYSFDLESLKKQNIGQTTKQMDQYNGSTGFTVSYVTQHALGGHSIPINRGLLEAMRVVGVVSDVEAKKGRVPGLERVVAKNKGIELGTLLHQIGVELQRSPYGPTIRKLLLEIDSGCKDRLPKRANRKAEEEAREAEFARKAKAVAEAKAAARLKADTAKKEAAAAAAEAVAAKKKPAKPVISPPKATPKKNPVKKKAVTKGTVKKKAVTKKAVTKKVAKKEPVKKAVKKKKKTATKKLSKRKPR